MDYYSLAALKLLCVQLRSAQQAPSQNAFSFGGILFQRAWLQGVLVSETSSSDGGGGSGRFLLDDGTGVIELHLSRDFLTRPWEVGMYVMVVGCYLVREGDLPIIKVLCQLVYASTLNKFNNMNAEAIYLVQKIVDLSPFPDRESMWYLEVMEVFKLFYQPLFQE